MCECYVTSNECGLGLCGATYLCYASAVTGAVPGGVSWLPSTLTEASSRLLSEARRAVVARLTDQPKLKVGAQAA